MKVPSDKLLVMQGEDLLRAYSTRQVTRIAVGGVLRRRIHEGYAVLLLQRVADDEYGGLEELPSGGVEPGETLGEALAREVQEETGLSVLTAGPFLFDITYPSRRGVTAQLNFLIEVVGDPPIRVNPGEHESFRWLPIGALADSGVSPNVRRGLCRPVVVPGLP
jgi:8-oxo-dGTP diphosphatase